jgi:hypothetical protein
VTVIEAAESAKTAHITQSRGARPARIGLWLRRHVWRHLETACHALANGVVLRPWLTVLVAVTVVMISPVTVRDLAGVTILVTMVLISTSESRVRLSRLSMVAKFRKRRSRVRRRWVRVMSDAGLVKTSADGARKRHPKLRELRPTSVGVALDVRGDKVGVGLSQLANKADQLRAGFGARDLILSPHPDKPTHTTMNLIYDDPFVKPILPAELPKPTKPLHVVVGLDSFGDPVEKDLRLPNAFFGMQGAGKSTEIWRILQGLQEAGIPHRVRVFDPKGGQEFVDLEHAAYYYERNPKNWPVFLERAFRALDARQAALRSNHARKNEFTRDSPLDVTIIDELLLAIAMSDAKTKIHVGGKLVGVKEAFMVYLSTVRSAGFTVLACSQLTQKSAISDIRDLFPYTTLLRVLTDDMVRSILGDSKLFPAHELPRTEETAGIGFMLTARGVTKYRGAWTDDTTRAAIAARMAEDSAYYRRQTSTPTQQEEDGA